MGLFDFLGNLTGFNQSNDSSSASHSSHVYQNDAANANANLQQQGNTQYGIANNNYLSLLQNYGGLSGLGTGVINPNAPKTTTPVSTQPVPGQQPGAPGAQGGQAGQAGQANNPQASNPYALDTNQQSLLNQQMAGIAQAQKQASASFTQSMADRGITDPRALEVGNQTIAEHFTDLTSKTQVAYYDQVKQEKEQAMQYLIAQIQGYGQQGIQQQEAAGQGFAQLSGAAANQSINSGQAAQSAFGNAAELTAFGLNGGFNGPPKAPIAPGPDSTSPAQWQGPLSPAQMSSLGQLGGLF